MILTLTHKQPSPAWDATGQHRSYIMSKTQCLVEPQNQNTFHFPPTYLLYPDIVDGVSFKHLPVTYTERVVSETLQKHVSRVVTFDLYHPWQLPTLLIVGLVLAARLWTCWFLRSLFLSYQKYVTSKKVFLKKKILKTASDNFWSAFSVFHAHFWEKTHIFKICALKKRNDFRQLKRSNFRVEKCKTEENLSNFLNNMAYKTVTSMRDCVCALKMHCFPKKRIVFQHVHFFIPLFENKKLSLKTAFTLVQWKMFDISCLGQLSFKEKYTDCSDITLLISFYNCVNSNLNHRTNKMLDTLSVSSRSLHSTSPWRWPLPEGHDSGEGQSWKGHSHSPTW